MIDGVLVQSLAATLATARLSIATDLQDIGRYAQWHQPCNTWVTTPTITGATALNFDSAASAASATALVLDALEAAPTSLTTTLAGRFGWVPPLLVVKPLGTRLRSRLMTRPQETVTAGPWSRRSFQRCHRHLRPLQPGHAAGTEGIHTVPGSTTTITIGEFWMCINFRIVGTSDYQLWLHHG